MNYIVSEFNRISALTSNDMMNFMSYIKDPKYTDLFEEIRAKFAAHGWLA